MNEHTEADVGKVISPFWTPEEAAAYLRVHVCTMQGLLRSGAIPAQRIGRQWRVLKRDIDAKFGIVAADAPLPGQV